jgi:hypothetical protein
VEAVCRDRGVASLQLSREEDVAELARAVDTPGAEAAALGLEVVEVEPGALVGVARRGHHPRARGGEPLEQQVREQEWGEVVERESLLEAVGGQVARGEHGARVVRKHVDARVGVEQLGREPVYLLNPCEVGKVLVHGRAAAGGARLLRSRPHAHRVAADDPQLGAAARELDGARLADPARGTSEDQGWHQRKSYPEASRRRRRCADLER